MRLSSAELLARVSQTQGQPQLILTAQDPLSAAATCQALFNACAAQGGAGLGHSALVRALELMANHNIGGRAESAQVGQLSDEPTFVWRLLNLNL